jgi:type I restriction enzyme M protein
MITGELRSKVDEVWDAFWSGGISNPLEVMEQITYLLFVKRLGDLELREENKANTLGKPMERRIFAAGEHPKKRGYKDVRWSQFSTNGRAEMFEGHVFPFARTLGGDDSSYAQHMKDGTTNGTFMVNQTALFACVQHRASRGEL